MIVVVLYNYKKDSERSALQHQQETAKRDEEQKRPFQETQIEKTDISSIPRCHIARLIRLYIL